VASFSYSKANKEKAISWSEETLYDYLLNPKKYIPGEPPRRLAQLAGRAWRAVVVHHIAAAVPRQLAGRGLLPGSLLAALQARPDRRSGPATPLTVPIRPPMAQAPRWCSPA
jgi:hypothetical protein